MDLGLSGWGSLSVPIALVKAKGFYFQIKFFLKFISPKWGLINKIKNTLDILYIFL